MADQKCSKVHISAAIPPIMINIFSVCNISKAKEFNPDIIFNYGIQYGG